MSNQPSIRRAWAAGTLALLTAALLAACGSTSEDGTFACGDGFCNKASQICMHTTADGVGTSTHACRALPQGCGTTTCGKCVDQANECLDVLQCSANADGDITVDCTTF